MAACRCFSACIVLLVVFSARLSAAADSRELAKGRQLAAATPPPPHKAPAKRQRPKKRHACAPDDARCVALREHTCDPYFTNVSDVCTFVQYNKHCAEDVHHIAYLPLFYCRQGDGRALIALSFLAWMGVLFWVMSKAAEDFLVPALEHLAHLLRMTPDVAGVTLFAFASGAPDLFTQIAAVAGGGNVDQELAISATLGGGLFIISVIFSVVVLCNKPPAGAPADDSGAATEITDRRAFVRDSLAYLLSTLALLGIMLRGRFSAWEAGLLLLCYAFYLAVCIWTSRGSSGAAHGGRHGYATVSPSQQQQQQQQANGGGPAGPALALEMAQLGTQQQLYESNGYAAGSVEQGAQPSGFSTPPGGPSLRRASPSLGLVSRTGSPYGRRLGTSWGAGDWGGAPSPGGKLPLFGGQQLQQQNGFVQDDGEASSELAVLFSGMPLSDEPAESLPAARLGTSPLANRLALRGKPAAAPGAGRLGRLLNSAALGLQEMLHTKGRSGPAMWLTMLMSPAVLVLHATMPALHPGHFTPWYALILSLCAPLFMLLSTELYPGRLATGQFLLTWLLSALALLALMLLAVPPAGPGGNSGSAAAGGMQPGSHASSSVALVAMARGSPQAPAAPGTGSPLAAVAAAASGVVGGSSSGIWAALTGCGNGKLRHLCSARRPRRSAILALLAAAQCMLWLSVAADELVSLFQAIGRICDISQDLLGATVLAWGEAVPELVATLTLARQGQATTAIAAVFGGPVFNILAAWAGPTFYSSLRKKAQPYEISGGEVTLVMFTLAILCFMLVTIPLVFGWRLARNAALGILAIYAASQVVFLLVEEL